MELDLGDKNQAYAAVHKNPHVVAQYFDKRTTAYFWNVMSTAFGVNTYWYRYEFAKSRGMIRWHWLCWRHDREPHQLLYNAVLKNLPDDDTAAESPQGTAEPPPKEDNPLFNLLSDISMSQETMALDNLLLTNKVNIHRCSDYCLRASKRSKSNGEKQCRMEFGSTSNPGKATRSAPAIVRDRNGCLRLEMKRSPYHGSTFQISHSRMASQWRNQHIIKK